MAKGWWWIRKPEELTAILTALHPRGIRERVLRKNLTKHMEFLTECCTQPMTGESVLKRQYCYVLLHLYGKILVEINVLESLPNVYLDM